MADPSLSIGTLPRVAAGYLKIVLIKLPDDGGYIPVLADQASWADSKSWQFTNYAWTPPRGPKQKTIHSIGTREVRITISGQLTRNSFDLGRLMDPGFRGVPIPEIFIQQGGEDVWLFQNVYWSNFSFSGQPDGNISFSFEGRATTRPQAVSPRIQTVIPTPIPSWYSGNSYVTSWQISHSVSMSPNWANTTSEYPAYYRPGPSEFSLVFGTAFAIQEHNTIRIGINEFTLLEALVQERTYSLGAGRTDPPEYNVTLTNCRFYRTEVGQQTKYLGTLPMSGQGKPYLPEGFKKEIVDTRHWKLDAYQNSVDYLLVGNDWPKFLPEGLSA